MRENAWGGKFKGFLKVYFKEGQMKEIDLPGDQRWTRWAGVEELPFFPLWLQWFKSNCRNMFFWGLEPLEATWGTSTLQKTNKETKNLQQQVFEPGSTDSFWWGLHYKAKSSSIDVPMQALKLSEGGGSQSLRSSLSRNISTVIVSPVIWVQLCRPGSETCYHVSDLWTYSWGWS